MLEELDELSIEGRAGAIDAAFSKVFSSPEGLTVLGVLLDDLYFMDECRGEGPQALNNYAKALLKRCGVRIAVQAVEAWTRVTSKTIKEKEES